MAQDAFAGPHTAEKLDALEKYLSAYSNVFKNQSLKTIFFDAFAGTGEIPSSRSEPTLLLDADDQGFVVGSALRALGPRTSFGNYIFVEKRRNKARELEKLRTRFPNKRITIVNEDANTALRKFCATTNWRECRAVVFLDPFGNQVEWTTIEALAATKAIDLWYLFPAGLGVHRQIGKSATTRRSMRTKNNQSPRYSAQTSGLMRASKKTTRRLICSTMRPLAKSKWRHQTRLQSL